MEDFNNLYNLEEINDIINENRDLIVKKLATG